ncbi:MAG: hypothetical protein QM756_12380 [Polyangiaceae bacterium]
MGSACSSGQCPIEVAVPCRGGARATPARRLELASEAPDRACGAALRASGISTSKLHCFACARSGEARVHRGDERSVRGLESIGFSVTLTLEGAQLGVQRDEGIFSFLISR